MLEIGLTGQPRKSIVLSTRKGTLIENYIAPDVSQQDINCYHGAIRPTHPHWRPRKDACGQYNCAGLVWASRRACLPDPKQWQIILDEDGYHPLGKLSEADIGDVVVYRSNNNGEIIHVAKICRRETLHEGNAPAYWALSKWDQRCGEDVHALNDVNLVGGTPFQIEIWTDRPMLPDPRIQLVKHLPRATG